VETKFKDGIVVIGNAMQKMMPTEIKMEKIMVFIVLPRRQSKLLETILLFR
jgi:hypothetical protein